MRLDRFVILLVLATPGCAGLRFNHAPQSDAFTYYEPAPFAVVKLAADCTISVDVISLPGKPRSVSFHSGLGSSKLSVTTANGMITQVGQETDTKIPETVTAVAGLAKSLGAGLVAGARIDKATCGPRVALYAINYNATLERVELSPAASLIYQAAAER